jgi:1-deoxy-D-xylulose-5-phosphate reductoisomerase
MKRIVILGSTGSIGRNTLDVVRTLGDRIRVVGLSTMTHVNELSAQVSEFEPQAASVGDEAALEASDGVVAWSGARVFSGADGLVRLAQLPEADLVVNAVVGAAGILPTLAAIEAGKDVAIANKESLVAAGRLIVEAAERKGVNLLPVDSEHSAVYQCIRSESASAVRRIVLTASGGPLVDMNPEQIANVRAREALRHPTWSMGRKVTIDSATLLNKGFEVIEAHWLFGIDAGGIGVIIERKSMVHALVEFVDGSVMALLSPPDMRMPIQYALTFPDRLDSPFARLDLESIGSIGFEEPDLDRFPCLKLAYEIARAGGTSGAVLSAADEIAVDAFLQEKIGFADIYDILKTVVGLHEPSQADDLDVILEADAWARQEARGIVARSYGGK